MTNREQLIQELEKAPDDVVATMLDFLHRMQSTQQPHPLAKFAGIISDEEAEEMQRLIASERKVDMNEW